MTQKLLHYALIFFIQIRILIPHVLFNAQTQLAELKTIFDRFAVEGAMTAPETCQALTEAGVIVPRRYV